MKTLNQRLDLIAPKIMAPEFRFGKGLGNEVNFWIFDYDPADEMAVRSHVEYLVQTINSGQGTSGGDGIHIVVFDLFEMTVDALSQKGYLDKTLQMEKDKSTDSILNPVKKTLRLTLPDDVIAGNITRGLQSPSDIAFIVGVGKAYPLIRSHTVLNSLKSRVEKNPVVMFFPGTYENELRLFGEITDDNYYRAFRLVDK